eukprot:scaffold42522_cov35-Phaeocystis_antarctica.AAC.2
MQAPIPFGYFTTAPCTCSIHGSIRISAGALPPDRSPPGRSRLRRCAFPPAPAGPAVPGRRCEERADRLRISAASWSSSSKVDAMLLPVSLATVRCCCASAAGVPRGGKAGAEVWVCVELPAMFGHRRGFGQCAGDCPTLERVCAA